MTSHPLCPMSSVSDSVNSRCCTKCDGLCRNSVSRHFCRDRCLKSWISPLFFSLHWFLTIFRKWGGRKAVPSLAPPLHRFISYAQLRNIGSGFCQNRGLFIPLYYIHNGRFENVKRKSEIFQKNFLYPSKGKEPWRKWIHFFTASSRLSIFFKDFQSHSEPSGPS